MKKVIGIILLFAVQTLCQSNNEVIDEFMPILKKYYDNVDNLQSRVMSETNKYNMQLASSTYEVQRSVLREQLKEKIHIRVEMEKILLELHLSSSNLRVKQCMKQSTSNTQELVSRSYGAEAGCEAAIAAPAKKALIAASILYDRIIRTHNAIQGSGYTCSAMSTNPAQLRNCLNHDLFVTHTRTIEELRKSSEQVLNTVASELQNARDQIQQCSNNVNQVINEDAGSIIAEFRDCCMNIVGNH